MPPLRTWMQGIRSVALRKIKTELPGAYPKLDIYCMTFIWLHLYDQNEHDNHTGIEVGAFTRMLEIRGREDEFRLRDIGTSSTRSWSR